MNLLKKFQIDKLLLVMALGGMAFAQDSPKAQVKTEYADFTTVIVDTKNDTITVVGVTPTPRKVYLVPLVYAAEPTFWAYQILSEKSSGVAIQVETSYKKTTKLKQGRLGIEVLGKTPRGYVKRLRVIVK